MTSGDEGRFWAALVPEMLVASLDRALGFYVGLCGFALRHARPEDGFAYLELGQAQIMLEEIGEGAWQTGPLDPPLGRGVNLQIEVEDLGPLEARLSDADWPLFLAPETAWYRDGAIEHGQRQLLVQDPDGYLLRFVQPLGERPAMG
jgi:catechol 2,3-dioxygenase-like lactoylglutathione lyase family enzyme